MNDEGKLLMMIRYAGSDAGREAYDSMLVELARLRAIEASVADRNAFYGAIGREDCADTGYVPGAETHPNELADITEGAKR